MHFCEVDDSVTDGDGTVISGDVSGGSVISGDAIDGGEVVDGVQVWTSHGLWRYVESCVASRNTC